jgi:hypothetical protein
MKNQTVPLQVLHCFLETNIEKHCSIKGLSANLREVELFLKDTSSKIFDALHA